MMGPSGSGKSTLLSILSGEIPLGLASGALQVGGIVLADSTPVGPAFFHSCGYVAQARTPGPLPSNLPCVVVPLVLVCTRPPVCQLD